MGAQRYLIKVLSDAALPDVLLRRYDDDRRVVDADLALPHDLWLSPSRSDLDELERRTFTEGEALAACREWHETQPLLDVLVRDRATTLVVVQWTHAVPSNGQLRLLPLMGESGAPVEMRHAQAAWVSTRADSGRGDARHIFHRPARDVGEMTPCAEVSAMWCSPGQSPRAVSARVAAGDRSVVRGERFPCFEQRWLESHYVGFDVLNAAPVLLTPGQAESVALALSKLPDFADIEVCTGSLRGWLGSGEFSAGATHPVRRVAAHPALSEAAGVAVEWVVWPSLRA